MWQMNGLMTSLNVSCTQLFNPLQDEPVLCCVERQRFENHVEQHGCKPRFVCIQSVEILSGKGVEAAVLLSFCSE
eukprot:m.250973 g.250973  ORF g.250973 m.250973 type:complete len:75 (+) comp15892_c0_seq4:100-324(+)